MTGMSKRTYLREVNPYLICPLCRGYLIDATTVVECLHSFCRSCILKHLKSEAQCPSCKHALNTAKPNIKADKALQDIVYKLVPGLYHKEMRRRREFYRKHPEHADSATPEQRGEDVSGRLIFAPEDAISLSLEFLPPGADPVAIILSTNDIDTSQSNANSKPSNKNDATNTHDFNRRYLQCPALVTIAHLKKFLALKYTVDVTRYAIEICHRRAPLPEHWTLMDVAYIYAWKRNAPLRFFYRIMQEEQSLEAPLNDRPSTPGVGASLPPVDHVAIDKNKICDELTSKKEKVTVKVNVDASKEDLSKENSSKENSSKENTSKENSSKEDSSKENSSKEDSCKEDLNKKDLSKGDSSLEDASRNDTTKKDTRIEDVKRPLTVPNITLTSNIKVDKKSPSPVPKESAKADKVKQPMVVEEMKQIKSPIKILKNSEGRYEVLRPSDKPSSPEARNNSSEKKSQSPEFSVVSIGEGPNSNGVKITLKQCSPGTVSSKTKFVGNIPVRNGSTMKSQEKSPQKDVVDKHEKHKRKVTFEDKVILKEADNETKNLNKALTEQSDKKQFLHGFRLTAKKPGNEQSSPDKNTKELNRPIPVLNTLPKLTDNVVSKSPEKKDYQKNILVESDTINPIKSKNSEKTSTLSLKIDKSNSSSKRLVNGITKDLTAIDNDQKIDVYAFPSEPVPAGAVKRKCPPGLPLFEVDRKRALLQGQIRKKAQLTPHSSPKVSKKQEAVSSSKKLPNSKDNSPTNISTSVAHHNTLTSRPAVATISDNTRNLLDGCGLNIPASLSITLTAPKSPSHSCSSTDTNILKDNQILTGKVNPSITLNDRSVDPRVLKALKTGQIRMPAPASRPKTKSASERSNQPIKRKKDDSRDILDLSGTKKIDIHPLRIPQPISKFKSKPTRENTSTNPASSQVVTLTSGQKYYRAPPGSLTPAVHRVTDYSQPPTSRGPVYAPSCFSSSLNSSCSSNNISSVFPSLQSLYALSQAPNLQQFQMDNRLRLPQPDNATSSGLGKSHLAAQCAPLKPARSSYASLAVPIVKQSPSLRPITLTAGIAQANELIKNKAINKGEINTKKENLQNSSNGKQLPPLVNTNTCKDSEKFNRSSSSPTSPHSKQEASTTNNAESNSHEAASPRVSSTVSPSPPPSLPPPLQPLQPSQPSQPPSSSSVPTNTDEVSSGSGSNCNKSGSEVTSSKSPESPDSSSAVNEHPINASGTTVGENKSQPSLKEDKLDSKKETEKQQESLAKSNDNVVSEPGDKKTDNIKVDAKQMTSEVFQKRLLAAFPSNEWANNPIAAKHLGNLLKSLTSMQTNNQTENLKKDKSDNSCETIPAKCVKDISPKVKAEVID